MSSIMFISLIQMHLYLHTESVFATLPHTQRATAVVLNGDPKGKNFLYCNGKTVVIRDINVSVQLSLVFTHLYVSKHDSKPIWIRVIAALLYYM